jgi:hypothetical protein
MNCGQSPCWPGVSRRVRGRQRRSAIRWILVDSPPRERPSASRPAGAAGGFLLFASAPRGQFRRQGAAGACGVLVGAHHRGIGAHRPVPAFGLITASPQHLPGLRPGAVIRPAAMPLIHRQPVPVALRQVPPRAARPGPEQDPVDRAPVISPPASAPRVAWQQRRQPRPLLILKIMTGNHSKVIYTPPGSRSRKHALALAIDSPRAPDLGVPGRLAGGTPGVRAPALSQEAAANRRVNDLQHQPPAVTERRD